MSVTFTMYVHEWQDTHATLHADVVGYNNTNSLQAADVVDDAIAAWVADNNNAGCDEHDTIDVVVEDNNIAGAILAAALACEAEVAVATHNNTRLVFPPGSDIVVVSNNSEEVSIAYNNIS